MKIAVEGCMHGELDIVYDTLRKLEEAEGVKIDLLLCCGDFQAVRNENDLQCVNVPQKYRTMNSFWKYYSGEAVAPYPTIFIGGNHEASNYLWELYYGGWAAPNIYFLGFAGVVKFGNIRIGGLSGIYNKYRYHLGHYERPPYNEDTIRSVYHVRHYDVLKLMHLKEPLDVFLSHDWPLGITEYGNWQKLISVKKHFEEEVNNRTLGSKPAAELLNKLKPPYWFSGHLHFCCRNPQTESFLQLLELPYLLDSSNSEGRYLKKSNSEGFGRNESSSQPGNTLDDEDIDEDEDALEDDE